MEEGRAASIMGYNVGQRCFAVGQYRKACGRPATPIPYRLGASHVTLLRTHHEEAEQPPTAAKEEPGEHPMR
jgi:hypothetical protein